MFVVGMFNNPMLFILFTLYMILACIVVLVAINAKAFLKELKKPKKWVWCVLGFLLILNIVLNLTYPEIIFTQDDEFLYPNYAKSLSEFNIEEIQNNHTKPIGFMFIVSLIFSVFGSSMKYIYLLNAIMGTLSVLAIFVVSYFMFDREDVGLYSAAFMSIFFLNITFANTMEIHSSATLFMLITLISFLFYLRVKTFESKLLALMVLAFTIYIRLEFLVLIIPVVIFFVLFDKTLKDKWKENVVLVILFLMFILPEMIYIYIIETLPASPYHSYDTSIFSLERVSQGLSKWGFPGLKGVFSPLTLLGWVALFIRNRKEMFFILSWIISFFIVYFSFWANTIIYLMPIYLMTILVWSAGIVFVTDYIEKVSKTTMRGIFVIVVVVLIVVLYFNYIPNVDTRNEQLCFTMEREAAYYLDSEIGRCGIVSVHSLPLIGKNIKGIQTQKILDDPEAFLYSDDCVLYLESIFCTSCDYPKAVLEEGENVNYTEKCDEMKDVFILTPYLQFNVTLPDDVIKIVGENITTHSFTVYNISIRK